MFPTGSPAISPSSAASRSVAADIEVARVPLSDAAKAVIAAEPAMLETALTGGDDYEIVCTVPPAKAESFRAAAAKRPMSRSPRSARSQRARAPASWSGGQPLAFKRAAFSHF